MTIQQTPKKGFPGYFEQSEKLHKLHGDDLMMHDITQAVKAFHVDLDKGIHRGVAAQTWLHAIESITGMSYENYLAAKADPTLHPVHPRDGDYTAKDAVIGAINMYYEQLDTNGAARTKTGQSIQAGTAMRTIESAVGLSEGREHGGAVRQPVERRPAITKRDPLIPDGSGRGIGN